MKYIIKKSTIININGSKIVVLDFSKPSLEWYLIDYDNCLADFIEKITLLYKIDYSGNNKKIINFIDFLKLNELIEMR